MALTNNQLSLIKLYLAAFNRAPEKNGLDYWAKQLDAGTSMTKAVSTVFSLDVVKAIYPDVLPDDAFLTQIYINIFAKLPDADGLAYWMGRLGMGAQRSWLVMEMINAGLGVPDGTPGKSFIMNRYNAAQYAVNTQLSQNASFNVNTLKSAMAAVNDDITTVNASKAIIDAINTGGLDGPYNPVIVSGVTNGYINAATKAAGISATVDLTGTAAVAGNTLLFLVNDQLFPTSVTYILTATDIKANKVTVKFPSTTNWGADGVKTLSVKVADVPNNHISVAGGQSTFVLDVTAPSAPGQALTTAVAAQATNGIGTAAKGAGVGIVVNLAGTNAAAGDVVQILLNGTAFSTPVTATLTASNITAGTVTVTIPGTAAWGTDGAKTLTAKLTDAAGNVGPTGGALSVTIDTVPPTLSTSSPADNATGVANAGNLVLTFNENVAAGTGNIIISNGAGDTRTIGVGDTSQVSFSGKSVTIKLAQPLLPSTVYNVQMASGVITDTSGNAYSGISSATTLNFTTSALPSYTIAQATAALAADPTVAFTIADTTANLALDAATNSGAGTILPNRAATFTTAASLSQLAAIDAATTGALTYTSVTDTASALSTNSAGYVKAGINVTVTDAASITQLAAIDLANGTGTLAYAAGVSDTASNLQTNSGAYVKAAVNVIITDTPSIAQLTAIDSANTTGTLTYALGVADTAAALRTDALLNSGAGKYVTGHNVVFTNAASIAQLSAVDAATTGTLTYALGVADTASALQTDAATNSGAGTYVTGHDVTFTDAPSIAQLTAVDAATTGTLTYTTINDTAANLSGNVGGYVKTGVNVTVTNAATISELTLIDTANGSGTLGYSAGVTDTAANLFTNTGGYVKAGTNVTVTTAATIAELTAIDAANTTGTLTYTAVTGSSSTLATNTGSYVKAGINVTVTGAATITELTTIDAANTTGTLTYTAVTGTGSALATNTGGYVKAGIDVTVTGAATITELTTIDAANTTGALTYTAVTGTGSALATNTGNYVKAGIDVTVTGAASISDLTTIDTANTTGALTYTAVTDTASALATNTGGYVKAGIDVTVSGAAAIADLTAIDAANTTGALTYTAVTDSSSTLATNTGSYVKAGINVTVTGAATITELTTIDASNTTGTLTYTAVTGTSSALATNTGGYVKAGINVTVTDTATITELTTIDAANTTGSLTYTAVMGSGSTLATNTGGYVKAGIDVTVTSAATVSDLTTIDATNTTGSLTYSTVTDSFANLRAASSLTSGATITAQIGDSAGDNAVGYTDTNSSSSLNDGDTFDIAAAATINLATVGLNAGDIFSFTGAQTLTKQATAAAAVANGEFMTIRGNWASGTGLFTVDSGTGTDTLVLFDNDATAGSGTSGIVLIGVTAVTAASDQITL